MEPLVTVVTPSWNQGRFIRDTIESVLAQDYSRIEYLVVDGGSTDETAEVVRPYRDRLTWISEADRGQSDAINKGFRRAKGEIVCWVNSDDWLLPGAISTVVEAFRRRPEAGLVYGTGYLTDERGEDRRPFAETGPVNVWRLVYLSAYILQPAAFFRRQAVEAVGYLDEELHWGMDWDLFIRIAKRHPIEHVPVPLACQREYPDTKTSRGGFRRFRELVRIMRRHGERRYPPAYFAYGLNTLEEAASGIVRRWVPVGIAPDAERIVRSVCRRMRIHSCSAAEGWYGDGWAGPKVSLLVWRDSDGIRIRGVVPEAYPKLRDQVLEVRCDGTRVATARIASGEFVLPVPLPERHGLVAIEIRASRHFVPRRERLNDDSRRLSYVLDAIEPAPKVALQEPEPFGTNSAGATGTPRPSTGIA